MNMTQKQMLGIAQDKGEIIRMALLIIDKLAENPIADMDCFDSISEFGADDIGELQKLIIKARSIKGMRWYDDMIDR